MLFHPQGKFSQTVARKPKRSRRFTQNKNLAAEVCHKNKYGGDRVTELPPLLLLRPAINSHRRKQEKKTIILSVSETNIKRRLNPAV